MITEKTEKNCKKYSCEVCDFNTSDKQNYTRHCSTRKHIELTKLLNPLTQKTENEKVNHVCSHCSKEYTSRVGLWKHSKICKPAEKENISMVLLDDDVVNLPIQNYIMKLVEQNMALAEQNHQIVEQNQDFKQTLLEQNNKMLDQSNKMMELAQKQNTTINNNKTINNTQFNLNVFLQETCKDAINMSDFINTLKIDAASLHHTGTQGYVNGISKIFTDGLRKLKVHERPIHCTDLKREVLYIKDNDKWEKDTEDNKQFKKALDTVVYRNMGQLQKWEEENPRCRIQETDDYEFYFEVIRQSLGGGNHDVTARNNEKILKAIAKEVHIDKKVKDLL